MEFESSLLHFPCLLLSMWSVYVFVYMSVYIFQCTQLHLHGCFGAKLEKKIGKETNCW